MPSIDSGDGRELIAQLLQECSSNTDTQNFVVLSVVRDVLDRNDGLLNNQAAIVEIWQLMPHSFLLRLLRSRQSAKLKEDVAQSMNQLAVGIIHTFVNAIPSKDLDDIMSAKYTMALLQSISILINPYRALAYHAMQCLASTSHSALAILQYQGTDSILLQALQRDATDLERIINMLRSCLEAEHRSTGKQTQFDQLISQLMGNLGDPSSPMIGLLTEALHTCLDRHDQPPAWVAIVVRDIHDQVSRKPNMAANASLVIFLGTLLQFQSADGNAPAMIFSPLQTNRDSPGFTQVFIKLLLADIRAAIPSLMATLAEPSYAKTALRLAMSFELLTAFLSLLMQSLDSDGIGAEQQSVNMDLDPDMILKLQNDTSEALALLLEYFRDRWDASHAGAAGLHESTRVQDPKSSTAPLQLAWDSPVLSTAQDPLILSGLRCLSIWLCEDDATQLLEQTNGIVDMLVSLYEQSRQPGNNDLRPMIVLILSSLLSHSSGAVDLFLELDGWRILEEDLWLSVQSSQIMQHEEDAASVLQTVVMCDAVAAAREAWMRVIAALAKHTRAISGQGEHTEASFWIAAYSLALSLYQRAPPRLRKLYEGDVKQLQKQFQRLQPLFASVLTAQEGLLAEMKDIAQRLQSCL